MYDYEQRLLKEGFQAIAGCDEVGRGPLAGPLVCAAVILNPKLPIDGLNDSKKLSATVRKTLDEKIKEKALAYKIVFIDVKTIDQINIYQATRKGMTEAVLNLSICADYVLSDAMPLPLLSCPYESIIKGDQKSATIAAASILAKVARDAYMEDISKDYPEYGFEQHKGYPTPNHIEMLKKHGVTPLHRRSFKPVKQQIHKQIMLDIEV